MATIYNEITSNKRRSGFLIAIFACVILALGFFISYYYLGEGLVGGLLGIFIATLFVVPFSLIGYYKGDKIALSVSQARPLTKESAAEVANLVENLSITVGFKKTPNVYLIESDAINAFATGRDPEHASIALTRGAIDKLERPELEAVIAHEISHIQNYDIRLMTVVVIFVGIVALLSNLFLRFNLFGGRRSSSNRDSGYIGLAITLIGITLLILSPLIAQLIKAAISRKREFLADASGALITRYPEGLARALEKIKMDGAQVRSATNATAHMYLAFPLKRRGMSKYFATHPPIDERIKKLREMGK